MLRFSSFRSFNKNCSQSQADDRASSYNRVFGGSLKLMGGTMIHVSIRPTETTRLTKHIQCPTVTSLGAFDSGRVMVPHPCAKRGCADPCGTYHS